MPQEQQLPLVVDQLIPTWRSELFTTYSWQIHPGRTFAAGEAGGLLLTCPQVPNGGWMKPANVKQAEECIAATEKICADIARDLKLPVPPVLLYNREPHIQAAESRCAISLVLYPNVKEW